MSDKNYKTIISKDYEPSLDESGISQITIDSFEITYCQDPDCDQDREKDIQLLKVKFINNGIDWFPSIDTCGTRWSVSDPKEIVDLVNDASRRMSLTTELK